jgi:hypothetical protein
MKMQRRAAFPGSHGVVNTKVTVGFFRRDLAIESSVEKEKLRAKPIVVCRHLNCFERRNVSSHRLASTVASPSTHGALLSEAQPIRNKTGWQPDLRGRQ